MSDTNPGQARGRRLPFRRPARRSDNRFDPGSYWERRHKEADDALHAVGCNKLDPEQQQADYDVKTEHVEAALRALPRRAGATLVDAGAGIGYFCRVALALGYDVTGFDLSETAVARARELVPEARFVCGSLTDVPEFSHDVDVVMCLDVLFHVTDDATWLASVQGLGRAIRPGGHLVIQEHFPQDGAGSGVEHVRWRQLDDYQRALGGWELQLHDRYGLIHEPRHKDLMVWQRPAVAPTT